MILFKFFLNDRVLLSYSINNILDVQLPLNTIEKVITVFIVWLTLYFIFVFGKLNKDEKQERLLVQRSEFWNTVLPGKNLVPILGKYYTKQDQIHLMKQLIVLLFRVKIPLTQEEKQRVEAMDIQMMTNLFNKKLQMFISSGNYKNETEQTSALLFQIVSLNKSIHENEETRKIYLMIKSHLLNKRPV